MRAEIGVWGYIHIGNVGLKQRLQAESWASNICKKVARLRHAGFWLVQIGFGFVV